MQKSMFSDGLSIREEEVEYEVTQVKDGKSPYEKVYWFARALVASEYGSEGSDTPNMLNLSQRIDALLAVPKIKLDTSKKTIWIFFRDLHRSDTQAASKVEKLIDFLDPLLEAPQDLAVLKFTIDNIVIPTNELLRRVPKSDKQAVESLVRDYLEEEGEDGLQDVIQMWDREGRRWCLKSERVIVVAGFRLLRETLDDMLRDKKISRLDADQTLTAFVQEFERRLVRGVRPGRAGRSLEDVTGVILDHFGIEDYSDAPEHIKTAFEVDKMIPLPDGWRIGVSCKRTLRERWKQAASLDEQRLDQEKVRSTWHVITYTSDLSAQKVEAIGESRGIVYVPDDDHFLQNCSADPSISGFIRPMTSFISDLKKEIQVANNT
jgi:hypothetical protein